MNPFNTAFLKAPKRSRFDFNHTNTVGLKFGALTPTYTKFITPGDIVPMSLEQICRLAPMPVPTFTSMKLRHDFFFVPLRLLYGSDYLDKLFGSDTSTLSRSSLYDMQSVIAYFSSFGLNRDTGSSATNAVAHTHGAPFVPGELLDYLGYPVFTDRNGGLNASKLTALATSLSAFATSFNVSSGNNDPVWNALSSTGPVNIEKIFAYHFIWRDWYRFTGIQDNTVAEPYISNGILSQWSISGSGIAGNPNQSVSADNTLQSVTRFAPFINGSSIYFGDLSYLKYAHLTKDMFTSIRYGNKPTVLIPTGANGTIPALREASALQRFLDIISITGQRYFDKVKGLFGVVPEGPKDDRVQFLGRYQQYIKVGEVLTTATTAQAQTGDYAGRGILIDGKYIFKRRFTEHGWLFCISSVIPNVAYDGLHRDLTDIYPIDSPLPSLAEVGDQSVLAREVHFDYRQTYPNNASLGDQFRYYAYKSAVNEVHGFFKMDTARPWSPLLPYQYSNIIDISRVVPDDWNYVFNDTANEYIFGDRFFLNLDFYDNTVRALPKYINYHL